MKQDVQPRLLLTIEEAAEELRMSPGYVRAKIRSGELPARKLGTRTRIERSALEAFIAKQPTVPDFVTTVDGQGQTLGKFTFDQIIEKMAGGR